jgi:hypothetical protein
MIRNRGDWDVEYLFEQIGALTCSRDRFGRLIEAALHPLGWRGPGQRQQRRRLIVLAAGQKPLCMGTRIRYGSATDLDFAE